MGPGAALRAPDALWIAGSRPLNHVQDAGERPWSSVVSRPVLLAGQDLHLEVLVVPGEHSHVLALRTGALLPSQLTQALLVPLKERSGAPVHDEDPLGYRRRIQIVEAGSFTLVLLGAPVPVTRTPTIVGNGQDPYGVRCNQVGEVVGEAGHRDPADREARGPPGTPVPASGQAAMCSTARVQRRGTPTPDRTAEPRTTGRLPRLGRRLRLEGNSLAHPSVSALPTRSRTWPHSSPCDSPARTRRARRSISSAHDCSTVVASSTTGPLKAHEKFGDQVGTLLLGEGEGLSKQRLRMVGHTVSVPLDGHPPATDPQRSPSHRLDATTPRPITLCLPETLPPARRATASGVWQ